MQRELNETQDYFRELVFLIEEVLAEKNPLESTDRKKKNSNPHDDLPAVNLNERQDNILLSTLKSKDESHHMSKHELIEVMRRTINDINGKFQILIMNHLT